MLSKQNVQEEKELKKRRKKQISQNNNKNPKEKRTQLLTIETNNKINVHFVYLVVSAIRPFFGHEVT